jgi:hypothetical protein
MPAFAAVNKKRLLMLPSFRDFGFAEWWKGIAVVLTGISAFLALLTNNKSKIGNLTKWGMIAISGIVICLLAAPCANCRVVK